MKRTVIFIMILCLSLVLAGCGAKEENSLLKYTLKFVDQNGDAVSGVTAQVCKDDVCMLYTSDDAGVCSFELEPFAYEIHILKLPEGYSGDTETITTAPEKGGELSFTLTKN